MTEKTRKRLEELHKEIIDLAGEGDFEFIFLSKDEERGGIEVSINGTAMGLAEMIISFIDSNSTVRNALTHCIIQRFQKEYGEEFDENIN